jgi:hypothetical protein
VGCNWWVVGEGLGGRGATDDDDTAFRRTATKRRAASDCNNSTGSVIQKGKNWITYVEWITVVGIFRCVGL